MKLCSFSRSLFALSLAVFITVVQRLTAPLPWLIVKPAICARCFPRWAPCCLETQRESRWGEESGGEGWTLIDKPHRQMNVSPLWVVKRWGNPTPPWNTFSTNLCTTKSTVSISSLPFNCSQLEHVAFWHGRAGDSHTHTHTHRGHSAGSVKVQQVCSFRSVSVQFISEPWVTGSQSFHQFSSFSPECEPQSHLWANLMRHTKDVLM